MPTFTDRLGEQLPGESRSRRWTITRRTSASITTSATTIGSSDASAWKTPSSTCPPGCRTSARPAAFASNQTFKTRARNIALSQTHVFGNNVINQFTAGYNRIFNYITSFGYGSNKSQELGIPGANLGTDETSSLTRMTFQNFVGIGDRGFSPFQGGTNVFHYTDTADDGEGIPRAEHRRNLALRCS